MRTFAANFITQKDASFAIPFLIADINLAGPVIRIASRTPMWDGEPIPINGQDYFGIVGSWGEISNPLEGFGEAFAAPSTEISILNDYVLNGLAFWEYLVNPNYVAARQTYAEIFWCFQHPDTGVIYKELALRGPITDRSVPDLSVSKITVQSRAESILNKDVLKTLEDATAPDVGARRVLPLIFNAANKMPMWIYSSDRSKFVIGEDIRGRGTSYTLGPIYYRGVAKTEDETSTENFPPEIQI